MSTEVSSGRSALPPRGPGDGRRGISGWAVIAAGASVAIGVYATWLIAPLTTSHDLDALLNDATDDLGWGWFLLHFAVYLVSLVAKTTLAWTGSRELAVAAAEIAVAVVTWAVSVAVGITAMAVADRVRSRHPSAAQNPPGEREIVLPRESGGGARWGGWAVTTAITVMGGLIWIMPRLLDFITNSHTDWQYYSSGLISSGIVTAGLIIAYDSKAFWDLWRAPAEAEAETESTTVPDLERFREALKEKLGPAVLADPEIRNPNPSPKEASQPPLGPASLAHAEKLTGLTEPERAAWADAVSRFDASKPGVVEAKKRNFVILEPLSRVHFAFIVEAISRVQDDGRITLLVTPDASGEEIFADIKAAFSVHFSDITQNIWADVDRDKSVGMARSVLPSVVTVTDETLEERILRRDAVEFAKVIERLGLIVLIDLHLFDLAQLRVSVEMLFQRLAPGDLRVVAHSARRIGVDQALEQMFAPTKRAFDVLSLTKMTATRFRSLVLRNDTDARDALLDRFYPRFDASAQARTSAGRAFVGKPRRKGIEPLPLIARIALRGDYRIRKNDIMIVDFGGDDAEHRWSEVGQRLVGADPGSDDLSRTLQELFESRTIRPDPDKPAPVVLVQDRANLVDVLTHVGLAGGGVERLVLVASENYPMRDYILDQIPGDTFTVEPEPFLLPIAPRPAGTLRELARLVLSRMVAANIGPPPGGTAGGGISRTEAAELFNRIRERRLLAAHRVAPTRRGIKALLETQYASRPRSDSPQEGKPGVQFDIDMERTGAAEAPAPHLAARMPVDEDLLFACLNVTARLGDVSGFVPLVSAGQDPQYVQTFGLAARDDFGLSYVRGSSFVTREKNLRVVRIDEALIEVDVADAPAAGRASAERPIFCRQYGVDVDSATTIVTPPTQVKKSQNGIGLSHFRLFAPVRRRTWATISEERMADRTLREPLRPADLARSDQVLQSLPAGMIHVLRFEWSVAADAVPGPDPARLAFTLQVTLGDILISLFPGLHHRVAVVAPQAGLVFDRLDAAALSNLEAHIAGRYPRLVAIGRPDGSGPVTLDAGLFEAALEGRVKEAGAGSLSSAAAAIPKKVVHVLVIEDWPGDLGVCGAIETGLERIQQIWVGYLGWLMANAERKELFYRFGTDTLIEDFTFAEAHRLVDAVT